jgi:integrase
MTAENLYETSGLRYQTVHRKTPTIPTSEQFQQILAEVRAEKKNRKGAASGDFLEFQGRAGLGQAEAAELKWSDIDFDSGEMQIKRVKTGKYFKVPVYPKLRPLLVRMRSEAEARAKIERREFQNDERVFIIDNARKALTNACERLDLPAFTQRNLRQMFIVEAYRAGVDVKTIAKWQGHQDGGKLIMDTYTEAFGADQREFEKKQLMKLT